MIFVFSQPFTECLHKKYLSMLLNNQIVYQTFLNVHCLYLVSSIAVEAAAMNLQIGMHKFLE